MRSGRSKGSIRYEYHLSRKMLDVIDLDLMSFDDYIKCPISGAEFNEVTLKHAENQGFESREDFCSTTGCKMTTFPLYLRRSVSGYAQGKMDDKTKRKLKDCNLGKKHSEETLKKLSDLSEGDKNPAKRLDVRRKIKENHMANTNPEKWKKVSERIGEKQKGKKLTKEHKDALAISKMRSLRHGSKAQLFAFEYIRRYFKIFKDINVYSNDHTPFLGCNKNYSVDISIPVYKTCIEWDGFWHQGGKNESEFVEVRARETKERDRIKEEILKNKGWKLIRIKDENKNGQNSRGYAIKKCRESFPEILKLIESQEEWGNWEDQYKKKDYIKINLSDLSERKKCVKCGNWIMKKGNKTGMCRSCFLGK